MDFDAGAAAVRPAHAPDDLGRGPADPYVARAALVPDMHECDFALIVDGDRTRPRLAQGYVLTADLPAPAGCDLLAGAERSSRTQCGARFVAHDRVPDALPEQQQEPEQRRQGDEQPRIVAGRLGRRVGVEAVERARQARVVPLLTGYLRRAGWQRSRRVDRYGDRVVRRVVQRVQVAAVLGAPCGAQIALEAQPAEAAVAAMLAGPRRTSPTGS